MPSQMYNYMNQGPQMNPNDMDPIKDLEMKLDYTQNERERQAIIDTINIIKNKG